MIPLFPSTSGIKSRIFRGNSRATPSRDLRRPRVRRLLCQEREGQTDCAWRKFEAKFPKGRGFTLKVQESNLTFRIEWEMIPIPRT